MANEEEDAGTDLKRVHDDVANENERSNTGKRCKRGGGIEEEDEDKVPDEDPPNNEKDNEHVIFLCLGEHGLLSFPMRKCKLKFEENLIVFCLDKDNCTHCEKQIIFPSTNTMLCGAFVPLSLKVNIYEIICFHTFVCDPKRTSLSYMYDILPQWDIDYCNVIQLFDYFGTDVNLTNTKLLGFVREHRNGLWCSFACPRSQLSSAYLAKDIPSYQPSCLLPFEHATERAFIYEILCLPIPTQCNWRHINYEIVIAILVTMQLLDVFTQTLISYFAHNSIFTTPLSAMTARKVYMDLLRKKVSSNLIRHPPKTDEETKQEEAETEHKMEEQVKFAHLPDGCEYEHLSTPSLLERLAFVASHNNGHRLYKSRYVNSTHVAKTLSIETELLKYLSPDECVVAGGACLKMACPETPFTERCDVDFFVLKTDAQWLIFKLLALTLLATGRHLYRNGDAVLTAIGGFHTRRIQVILAQEKTAYELIMNFDLPAIRSYYDGHLLHATCATQYDWMTKTCSTKSYCNIQLHRLFGMHWKGFVLSQEAQTFLKKSVFGFNPPKTHMVEEFEHAIPFIPVGIPMKVVNANLYKQHRYVHLTENDIDVINNEKDDTSFRPFQFHRYGNHPNIWTGSIKDYITDCSLGEAYEKHKFHFIPVIHDFALVFKQCEVRQLIHPDSSSSNREDYKHKKNMSYTITGLSNTAFKTLVDTIPSELAIKWVDNHKLDKEQIVTLVITKASKECHWILNGLPLDNIEHPMTIIPKANVLLKPLWLYQPSEGGCSRSRRIRMRWQLVQVSWIS